MRLRLGLLLLLLLFGYAGMLSADFISPKRIGSKRAFLQVGAFSKKANFERMRQRLHRFPLWADRSGGMLRLFVVLPREGAKRRILYRRVRAIVPDAFVRHGYRPDGAGAADLISHKTRPLDARAILQTRKKFF